MTNMAPRPPIKYVVSHSLLPARKGGASTGGIQVPVHLWLVYGASSWRSGDGKTLFRAWHRKMTTAGTFATC
jgi:hypothetical protein